MSVQIIDARELKSLIESHEEFTLVNVLDEEYFNREHISGSINLPVAHLKELAGGVIPDLEEKIIVYCASEPCSASTDGTRKLVEMGYKNVTEFAGGIEAWKEAGYQLVGSGEAGTKVA